MRAKTYNLPQHTSGNTFEGFVLTIKKAGSAMNLTGASVLMELRSSFESNVALHSYTIGDGFTITNAVAGELTFDSQIIDLPIRQYYYDLTITNSAGEVYTVLKGIWLITKD